MSKKEAIIGYIKNHPEADNKTVAKAVKCSVSFVVQVRRTVATKGGNSIKNGVYIDTGNSTLTVAIRDGGGCLLGTVIINSEGLTYRRPKQKLQQKSIGWTMLEKIMGIV